MFKAVVDAGGFSQAAERVYKSQSSIHNAVTKLEDNLGIQLLEVKGRKTVLTQDGKLLYRRAAYLLDEVNRIESVADTLKSGVESDIQIAIDGAFPQSIVLTALEHVSSKFPHLRFDIIDTVLSGSNQLLSLGKVDIAISPMPCGTGLNEELCSLEFMAVAHKDHPLNRGGKPLVFEDLKPFRQIIARDSATENQISAGWRGAEQCWTVSHIKASIEMVATNLGFAWLPIPAIQSLLDSGTLIPLNLSEGLKRSVSFYLNYSEKDILGPATKELMGQLRLLTMDMISPEEE